MAAACRYGGVRRPVGFVGIAVVPRGGGRNHDFGDVGHTSGSTAATNTAAAAAAVSPRYDGLPFRKQSAATASTANASF